jgi:short-subunit dehydrogenase/mannose-6-phosphate isomerase-like protein (cupin superfamily)
MNIRGSVVLVTGASSGIGAATARKLARKGAKVLLLARGSEAMEQIAQEIRAQHGFARAYAVDLGDAQAVQKTAEAIRSEFGSPDVLINNAGAGRFLYIEETEPDELHQMITSPYLAAFLITRAFLPGMIQRGSGRIVNVTSPAAYFPWPGATAYTAARWAMRGFTAALRADLRGTGVRVTLVVPGKVRSTYFEHNPGAEERLPGISRIYRTLTPEDVATAILSGVEHDRSEVITPFLLKLTVLAHRLLPGLVEWLVAATGWKRSINAAVKATNYMANPGDALENPVTGERIIFRARASETGGRKVVIDHFLPPHTGTFAEHVQLNQEERFEILSGTATYRLNGEQSTVQAGDVILVPCGAPHKNPWNESDQQLVFRHETSPDFGSDVFFESVFSLAQDGKTNRKGETSVLQLMTIGANLESQTYVTNIPIPIQRVMMPVLGTLGRWLGYPTRYSLTKAKK